MRKPNEQADAQDKRRERQMSEAFINSAFLALSGGFQDAYTYNTREEVFSNAQTGNVVLMSQHFITGQWQADALAWENRLTYTENTFILLYSSRTVDKK